MGEALVCLLFRISGVSFVEEGSTDQMKIEDQEYIIIHSFIFSDIFIFYFCLASVFEGWSNVGMKKVVVIRLMMTFPIIQFTLLMCVIRRESETKSINQPSFEQQVKRRNHGLFSFFIGIFFLHHFDFFCEEEKIFFWRINSSLKSQDHEFCLCLISIIFWW